ncbi:BQ2448_5919 [Microbotryum intermedium]|uniref:shikimate kinase n=1 Tax=Microbotryum intermedium TaxID=269621 RepID=A0A238F5T9_9BASI|nr:BQ2448_5919 [Microbotryum intermedium]
MPHAPLYDADATIALIGMRGVGKTTLGLIAATSLRRQFIDADSAFQTLHGPITNFVKARGWADFRDKETAILKQVLHQYPRGYVIACGGGVVEREENRTALRQFRAAGHPIVHVVRDKEETIRPSWGEEIRAVWSRRTPYFEDLRSHTIVSLTAHPPPPPPQFLMKHVETAFVRLLRSIFGLASSHVPLIPGPRTSPIAGPSSGEYGGYGACESEMGRGAKGQRTSFVALNFPDLLNVSGETIRKVAGGVDVIELRVNTLRQLLPETPPDSRGVPPAPDTSTSVRSHGKRRTHMPSPHFVTLCFGHLRRGGEFPDLETEELMEEYLVLVELGFKLGAEYVDLELSLPDAEIVRPLALRGAATQCLGADHDRVGVWKWDSPEMVDKYLRAARLGVDIIKLVSTPTSFESNLELLKFRAKVSTLESVDRTIPLLAINLGKGGQLFRFLNPVFSPVTHPLLPGKAAPGQLTYAQTQQALFLSGLTLEKTFFVPSHAIANSFSREAHHLGLPYTFIVEDRLSLRETEPDFGGAFLSFRKAIRAGTQDASDHVLSPAKASSWIDLVVPACSEPTSYDEPPTPKGWHKHTNVRVLALADIITQPQPHQRRRGAHLGSAPRWVHLYACDSEVPPSGANAAGRAESIVAPSPRSPTTHRPTSIEPLSRSHTPSVPYPHHAPLQASTITSFSDPRLYARRPPTIIIAAEKAPTLPDFLFASPTGGAAVDLACGEEAGGELSRSMESKADRSVKEGWRLLSLEEVQVEVERQAFRALTGRRMGS